MARTILHVTFDFDFERNEDRAVTIARAYEHTRSLPGMVWKVWLRDRETGRGGGIYLFEDRETAQAWVDESFAGQPAQPWTSNLTYELLTIDEELSTITKAHLGLEEPTNA